MSDIRIVHGDVCDVLPTLADNQFDVVWLDPPFNVGKEYNNGHGDKLPSVRYWEWVDKWFSHIVRVLKPTGSIWFMHLTVNIGHISVLYAKYGITLHNVIVWTSPESQNTKRRFVRRWQSILFGTKHPKDYYFNTYYETRLRYERWSGNDKQRGQLSDIWDDIPRVYSGSIVHKEAILVPGTRKKVHPCQAPVRLTDRIIGFGCPEHGVLLDPFLGSGSSLVSATNANIDAIGIDSSYDYCVLAAKRFMIRMPRVLGKRDPVYVETVVR